MAKVDYTAIKRKTVDVLEAQAVEEGSLEGVLVNYGPLVAAADVCPYVAVYGNQITRSGGRIGGARPRNVNLTLKLDCVAFSAESFEASDDALMTLLDAVEEVLDDKDNATLGGLAVYIEITDIDLDEFSNVGFFSGATITLRVECRR